MRPCPKVKVWPQVAPTWMNLSLAIFHDEETAKEWGWVQVRHNCCCTC